MPLQQNKMPEPLPWPAAEAFLEISQCKQIADGRVRLTAIAICDAYGRPCRHFWQGQWCHFYYEFQTLEEIGMPSGGVEFWDESGRVVHGKNALQSPCEKPCKTAAGAALRFHQSIQLDVSPGRYEVGVGFSSADGSLYHEYEAGLITYQQLSKSLQEHCRARNLVSFDVGFDECGRLRHHGSANLPGECNLVQVLPRQDIVPDKAMCGSVSNDQPTVFHITHWKAGSQWIHRILKGCTPDRIVDPELGEVQFLHWPLQGGKVYPTVYVTRQQFESVCLPRNSRWFVVIRDLRDTLVSAYFSVRYSHPLASSEIARLRNTLKELDFERGMISLMEEWLPGCARIQVSWLEAGEQLIRYEDLLGRDLEILEPLLIDHCRVSVDRERLREVVLSNRFVRVTQGRESGREDIYAHERKGIAGDWRNYFTRRLKDAFKARYGGLLVATGYETHLNW